MKSKKAKMIAAAAMAFIAVLSLPTFFAGAYISQKSADCVNTFTDDVETQQSTTAETLSESTTQTTAPSTTQSTTKSISETTAGQTTVEATAATHETTQKRAEKATVSPESATKADKSKLSPATGR